MKRILIIPTFLFLLSGAIFSQNITRVENQISVPDKNLLLTLLNFPSPPEKRSEQIKVWLSRENEKLSGKTNIIPADDAPIEEVIKFWAGKRIYDVPKPSEIIKERLLETVKKDS